MAINRNFRADQDTKGWLTNGTLYFAILDANDNVVSGYKSMGAISGVTVNFEVTKLEKSISLRGAKSKWLSVVDERNGTIELIFDDFTNENISKYTYGEVVKSESQTGKIETIKAYLDSTIPLKGIVSGALTVKNGADTYEEGKNYEVNEGSIFFYSTAEQTAKGALENIAEGTVVTVTYDSKASSKIQSYIKDSLVVALYFEGRNIANNDNEVEKVLLHKVQLDPTSFPVLARDEIASVTVNGSLLPSKAIQASGESQYMEIINQDKE